MANQELSWTCSVCTLTWVINATGTDTSLTRTQALQVIGYPKCVNETYGLMSSECLMRAFAHYGVKTKNLWLSFDEAWALAGQTTGGLSGRVWNHWVAIRGQKGPNIWVANSAPGWRGVLDIIDRRTFESLGPFKAVYLVD